jgi:SAM-dependent methyltransferase
LVDDELAPPARVLIVGCGLGREVEELARRGFEVTGLDIAPSSLDAIVERIGRQRNVRLVVGDVLELSPAELGRFDALIEHTCFCALDPQTWPDYVASTSSVLGPGGRFLGAFLSFENREPLRPPYGTDAETVSSLFAPQYHLRRLAFAEELFPPPGLPTQPNVYRVRQLEAAFDRRP